MSLENISSEITELSQNIVLIYAFNGVGKTRLSVAYKDVTKSQNNNSHSGVYYNAYSEDLFVWNNDDKNNDIGVRLNLIGSSLNKYHSAIDEDKVREKLSPFKPKYDFEFKSYDDIEKGIEYIQFFIRDQDENIKKTEDIEDSVPIKISRGEEQVFIWCFFLALFDVEGWTGEDNRSSHFFIDDPVSSLDDHNIFVTVSSLMDLIDQHLKKRKIIITTHHIGFFSILADWLTRGGKADRYKQSTALYKLCKNKEGIDLVKPNKEVFLYHLELLRILKEAVDTENIYTYHFALIRQVLENISSFLGYGNFSSVLEEIGIKDKERIAQIVNIMSHKTVFRYELKEPVPDNIETIKEIVHAVLIKYNFKL